MAFCTECSIALILKNVIMLFLYSFKYAGSRVLKNWVFWPFNFEHYMPCSKNLYEINEWLFERLKLILPAFYAPRRLFELIPNSKFLAVPYQIKNVAANPYRAKTYIQSSTFDNIQRFQYWFDAICLFIFFNSLGYSLFYFLSSSFSIFRLEFLTSAVSATCVAWHQRFWAYWTPSLCKPNTNLSKLSENLLDVVQASGSSWCKHMSNVEVNQWKETVSWNK